MKYRIAMKTRGDKHWVINPLEFDTEDDVKNFGLALERDWYATVEWIVMVQDTGRLHPAPSVLSQARIHTGKSWVTEPD
jgi:hypothetical protein